MNGDNTQSQVEEVPQKGKGSCPAGQSGNQKQLEDEIKHLRKTVNSLTRQKKELEEVVMKQEDKVTLLSSKVTEMSSTINEKQKEIDSGLEYTAKLTSMLSSQKKEISKLKQNQPKLDEISKMQTEIKNLKKELDTKDNKISLLTTNNRILQNKITKLSNASTANSSNTKPSSPPLNPPLSSGNIKDSRNKIILNRIKPHSQQQHKTNLSIKKNQSINHNYFNTGLDSTKSKNCERKSQKIFFNSRGGYENKKDDDSQIREKCYIVAKEKKSPFKLASNSKVQIQAGKETSTNPVGFDFGEDFSKKKLLDLDGISRIENTEGDPDATLKPVRENQPKVEVSMEGEFPIIESYCVLKEGSENLKKGKEDFDGGESDGLDDDDGLNEVAKLHNCVNNILNQF